MIIDPDDHGIILDPDVDLSNCHVYWYASFKPEYFFVYELGSQTEKVLLHRWVWEQNHGSIPVQHSIHHLNGNQLDNRLANLQLMSTSAHHRLHSTGRIASAQERLNMSAAMKKKYRNQPEIKDKIAASIKARYDEPGVRENMSRIMSKIVSTPEYKKKMSEISKANWQRPEYREHVLAKMAESRRRNKMNKEMIEKIETEMKMLDERMQQLSELKNKLQADPRALERDSAQIGISITSECSFESFPEK